MSNSAITGPIFTDVRRSPSGSAAAPSWSFADSTGTGVYLVSAGVLGLSTNGVQRVVVNASGNVGIGTSTPQARLDLGNASGERLRLYSSARIGFGVDMGGTFGNSAFTNHSFNWGLWDGTTWTERMRIDGSGKVGIGTASPDAKLTVYTGTTGNLAHFTDGINADFYIKTSSLVTTIGPNPASTSMAFQTAGTERMRIDASGKVGIGTTSPGAKLDVKGGNISVDSGSRKIGYITDANANNTGYIIPYDSSGFLSAHSNFSTGGIKFHTGTANTERMRIDASGKVTTKAGLLEQNLTSFSNFNTCLTPMTAFSETAEFMSELLPTNSPVPSLNWWFCKVYSARVGAGGAYYVVQTATSIAGTIYTRYSFNSGSTWSAWAGI